MAATAGFRTFVVEHEGPLLRTAYLLTGDRRSAEELLTAALASTHRRWRRVAAGDPLAAVRRAMLRSQLRPRHRSAAAGRATPSWSPGADAEPPRGAAEEFRQALLGLPPRTRAALVLRLHEALTEVETADALGCSPGAAAQLIDEGTAALRGQRLGGATTGPSPAALPLDAPSSGAPAATPPPADDDAIYRRPR
jgi:DNA-directed RNA polymerase specialized sigma24 family protein